LKGLPFVRICWSALLILLFVSTGWFSTMALYMSTLAPEGRKSNSSVWYCFFIISLGCLSLYSLCSCRWADTCLISVLKDLPSELMKERWLSSIKDSSWSWLTSNSFRSCSSCLDSSSLISSSWTGTLHCSKTCYSWPGSMIFQGTSSI